MKFSSLVLLFITTFSLSAQYQVSGKIVDATTGEPLSYANVVDVANQYRGTLTNLDGSFALTVPDANTELFFSYLGYQHQRITASQLVNDPIVRLKAESITLAEIEVISNNDALYEAVIEARKNLSKAGRHQGRLFFQLTTTDGEEPIEMLQNFYNGETENGSIRQLSLKNGRIAVTGKDELAFSNLSTSRAFVLLDLLNDGPFPSQPLELKATALRKEYELTARPDFSNFNLLHLNFDPYVPEKSFFAGEMWIDQKSKLIKKLILRKENLTEHPFETLQQTDEIRKVDLEVGYTFKELDGRTVINYIQLDYRMELIENVGTSLAKKRTLNCQGIMQFYAPDHLFFLSLPLPLRGRSDYMAVYDLGYDPAFWKQNPGLVFTEKQLEQQAYLEETGLLMNFPPETDRPGRKSRYLVWKANRRISSNNTLLVTEPDDLFSIRDKKAVKFFVHVDNVDGKPVPRSVVLLDRDAFDTATPKSDRYFEVLNLYCDLAEIARRNFDAVVAEKPRDYDKLVQLYGIENFKLRRTQERFIRDMVDDDDGLKKFQRWKAKIVKLLAKTVD